MLLCSLRTSRTSSRILLLRSCYKRFFSNDLWLYSRTLRTWSSSLLFTSCFQCLFSNNLWCLSRTSRTLSISLLSCSCSERVFWHDLRCFSRTSLSALLLSMYYWQLVFNDRWSSSGTSQWPGPRGPCWVSSAENVLSTLILQQSVLRADSWLWNFREYCGAMLQAAIVCWDRALSITCNIKTFWKIIARVWKFSKFQSWTSLQVLIEGSVGSRRNGERKSTCSRHHSSMNSK